MDNIKSNKYTVSVTKTYDIVVDESNYMIQEYEGDLDELISDLVCYNFTSVSPLISESAVKVINESEEFEY